VATFASNFGALYALSGGGVPALSAVLGAGNDTGGNPIIVSSSDQITGEDNPAPSGDGFDLLVTSGKPTGGLTADGGDIVLDPANGIFGGADGEVLVNGNLTVTGNLTITGLSSGAGSPEGVLVANISAIYQRTDGGLSNAWYIKSASSGFNTGWIPGGPEETNKFSAVGSPIFTTARPFFESVSLGVEIKVYLNGVRQRVGVLEDYQITGASQITFNFTPSTGDLVTIEYLAA
jgi:hypothetical protein